MRWKGETSLVTEVHFVMNDAMNLRKCIMNYQNIIEDEIFDIDEIVGSIILMITRN